MVGVALGPGVLVMEGVGVMLGVAVLVPVDVGVTVGVLVIVEVGVMVGVFVFVPVDVGVTVGVRVGVALAITSPQLPYTFREKLEQRMPGSSSCTTITKLDPAPTLNENVPLAKASPSCVR